VVTINNPYPRRFRNYEDAMLFMECMKTGANFPPDKIVWPFISKDGHTFSNPEYRDAHYELGIIQQPTQV
jgi:hypothetical protein